VEKSSLDQSGEEHDDATSKCPTRESVHKSTFVIPESKYSLSTLYPPQPHPYQMDNKLSTKYVYTYPIDQYYLLHIVPFMPVVFIHCPYSNPHPSQMGRVWVENNYPLKQWGG
jgi:hypothetical protein